MQISTGYDEQLNSTGGTGNGFCCRGPKDKRDPWVSPKREIQNAAKDFRQSTAWVLRDVFLSKETRAVGSLLRPYFLVLLNNGGARKAAAIRSMSKPNHTSRLNFESFRNSDLLTQYSSMPSITNIRTTSTVDLACFTG
jgi:hypothetical protein